MKEGDLVRCTTNGYRHIVGIVLEYPEQKWTMVLWNDIITSIPVSQIEVINESRWPG